MTDELPEQAEPERKEREVKKQDEAPAGPPVAQSEGSRSGTGQQSKRNRGVVTSAWQRLFGRRG